MKLMEKNCWMRFFFAILSILSGIIIFNNAFFSHLDYVTKKIYPLPAIEAFLIAAFLVYGITVCPVQDKKPSFKIPVWVILAVFFLYQAWVAFQIMFITDSWDSGSIFMTVIRLTDPYGGFVDTDYFSHYTYNDGIFLVEYAVVSLMRITGFYSEPKALYALMVIQCLCSTAVAALIYDVLRRLHDKAMGRIGLYVYIFWFGLIGWQTVVYNDLMSIVFPVLAYDIYLSLTRTKKDILKWAAIFVVVFLGYKIKPTVLLILIAIGMTELFYFITNFKECCKRTGYALCVIATAAAVFTGGSRLFDAAFLLTPVTINKELNTGPLHMLMMGVNSENDGCFVFSDVAYSFSFEDKNERTQAQLAMIEKRLSEYTPATFLAFLSKKALVVFNDGTFAWGEEARFYEIQYTKGVIPSFYKELYYKDGSFFFIKQYLYQLLWYMTLILLLFCVKQRCDRKTLVLSLSVTGLFVFDMLFEARARYLIVYVPVIMVLAIHNGIIMAKKSVFENG